MSVMTALPSSRPFTRADLAEMPDDGHRYELIDGALIVTAAPSFRHQQVLGELYAQIKASCPAGFIVLFAPFAVEVDQHIHDGRRR